MTHGTLQRMPSPECKFLILFYNAPSRKKNTRTFSQVVTLMKKCYAMKGSIIKHSEKK